jgi:CHAT domain-containing protein
VFRTSPPWKCWAALLFSTASFLARGIAAEEVVVLSHSAEIKSHTAILARPKFSDKLRLVKVKAPWHQVEFRQDGTTQRGWIHEAHLLPRNLTDEELAALVQASGTWDEGAEPEVRGDYQAALALRGRAHQAFLQLLGARHMLNAAQANDLAGLHTRLGDHAKAVPLLQQALETHKVVLGKEHPNYATSLDNLAKAYCDMGDHARAEPLALQALDIRKSSLGEDHPDYARSLHNLGELYRCMADYERAEPLIRQAIAIKKAELGDNNAEYAESLDSLAIMYRTMGDFARAEPLARQAVDIHKAAQGEKHPNYASSLNNLAALYHDMGVFVRAEPLYRESMEIHKAILGKNHPSYAGSMNNLAAMYKEMHEYARAEPLYRQAMEIHKDVLGENHPDYAGSLNNLAELYRGTGEYERAEPLMRQAVEIKKAALGADHPSYASSLNNLALLYEQMDDAARAEPLMHEALRIQKAVLGESHPDYAVNLSALGKLLGRQGRWPQAADQFNRARRATRRHVARVLPSLAVDQQRAFLDAGYQQWLALALSIPLAQPHDVRLAALAAEWAINGKGIVHEVLAARALLARESTNPDVAPIAQELATVRQRLAALALSVPAPGEVAARQTNLARLEGEAEDLAKRLGQATGTDYVADPWVDLTQVRQALGPHSALVEIVRMSVADSDANSFQPPRYVAWVIPAAQCDAPVQVVDLGDAAAIDQAVSDLRDALVGAPAVIAERGEPAAVDQVDQQLRQVAQLVLDPLLPLLRDATDVVVSPDASLWLVPWAALSLADGSYAIERYTLRYVISGRDLVQRKQAKAQSAPLIVANPRYGLPPRDVAQRTAQLAGDLARRGAARLSVDAIPTNWAELPATEAEALAEVPRIKALTGDDPRVCLQVDAIEAVVKATNRPRMLVLATHGYFLPDQEVKLDEQGGMLADGDRPKPALTVAGKPLENPLLRCGLVFAGANTRNQRTDETADDGLLTGLEIVGMDLRGTELVVLSACETGLGDVRNGEGVAGLRQAFQLAGAEAVVATLWQIPDKDTAIIMGDFFANLAAGQSKAEALRNAQLKRIAERRERNGAAHPLFWAAFTLTGN